MRPMNFAFTEEQEELRKTVRAFLEAKSSEAAVREQMDTDDGYDPAVWSQMAEQMGLQGLAIPEEFGGSGFGYVELGIVLEEMGRSLLCAPFFSSVVLAANTLILSGDDAAKQAYLPGIASGETIATLAFTEPSASGTNPASPPRPPSRVAATRSPAPSRSCSTGARPNLIIVAAKTAAGTSLFAVDGDAAGLTRTAPVDDGPDPQAGQARVREHAGRADRRRGQRLGRAVEQCSTSRPSASPPSRSVAPRRCSRWRSSTPRSACSSVARSVRSRPSSTSAPTCCSRSSRPSRLRTTACGVRAR